MPEELVTKGPKGHSVVFWSPTDANLQRLIRSAKGMPQKDVKKVLMALKVFVETGKYPTSKERFKQLEGYPGLFEFKGFQVRWLGTMVGNKFVVLHVVLKKRQTLPSRELVKVKKMKERYDEEVRSDR